MHGWPAVTCASESVLQHVIDMENVVIKDGAFHFYGLPKVQRM
jgi:hypothetical protein